MNKKFIVFSIIVVIIVALLASGAYFFQQYILPRLSVNINNEVTGQTTLNPNALRNRTIDDANKFETALGVLFKLNVQNSSSKDMKKSRDQVLLVLNQNRDTLKGYKTNLTNYSEYESFITAAIAHYDGYEATINQFYSNANLALLFKPGLSEAEANSLTTAQTKFNAKQDDLENRFAKLLDEFKTKYKLQ